MARWQRINIVQFPDFPFESQKLNDDLFDVYDKLHIVRTLYYGSDRPQKPVEGELYNDGEKVNVYLGPGLGPEGDGWVPLAYTDPDGRYPLLTQYNEDMTNVNNTLSDHQTTLDNHQNTLDNHEQRIGNIEDNEIPTINNRLDGHDATLADHDSRINDNYNLANDAYSLADTANTTANNAYNYADQAHNEAVNAQDTANNALSMAQEGFKGLTWVYLGHVPSSGESSSWYQSHEFTKSDSSLWFTGIIALKNGNYYIPIPPEIRYISQITSWSDSNSDGYVDKFQFRRIYYGARVQVSPDCHYIWVYVPAVSETQSGNGYTVRYLVAYYWYGDIYALALIKS